MAKGARDMKQRANEEARRILKEYHPQYFSLELCEELDKFAKEAQERVLKKVIKS